MCVCIGVCMHVCMCSCIWMFNVCKPSSLKKILLFHVLIFTCFSLTMYRLNFKVCFSINILLKNCSKIQIAWNLNRFVCVLHSIVNYIYIIIRQKPRTFSSCMTKILHRTTPLFYLPVAPGSYHSTFCFYEFDYFIYLL